MIQITPQMVKELREKTGAGMGDCKKALTESDGDMQAAIEFLRKKGAASAAKRSDRISNEGLIVTKTSPEGKTAVIVEINCETDFVARNTEFEKYSETVANTLLTNDITSSGELLAAKVGSDTIGGIHNEILAKFGEKIEIRRFEKIKSDGFISEYIHTGSKLAVLVESSVNLPSDKNKSLLRDISMQVAAMNPSFVDRNGVSKEKIDKEIEIYRELAVTEGKKPEIAEKIAISKLEKFFQEQCLLEQTFVKDPGLTIKDVVKQMAEEAGSDVKILGFRRYFLGES